MKFISKHTEGPWDSDTKIKNSLPVCYSEINGIIVASIYCDYDANLISQAQAMLDYMIERAKKLDASISLTGSSDILMQAFGDFQKEDKQELTRIIEILKAAGVEVINE